MIGNQAVLGMLQRESRQAPVVQRDDDSDGYRHGFRDAEKGREKNPGPRIGDGIVQYNEGYAKGLDARLKVALDEPNWRMAAEVLNAFNVDDILARIAVKDEGVLLHIEQGAWENPRVGKNAQVAQVIHDVVAAVHPGAYYSGPVFPNNFGDKLGGVGGVVVGIAAGIFAAQLAAPLLAGFWRQIALTAGMARVAAEADKEDAQLAEMEIGAVINRLMNAGGGRVLVTYQSAAPAADRELYLTTEAGAQYAEAVAQGRNLYQLRIPERLFQLLQQRQLIELRQGSMGNQVGEDIRISAGAMQFLSKYIKEIPLK